tara:strand:- start:464 stop:1168 length:705 start_codon:yes stop_codon:yes gene_type:complete
MVLILGVAQMDLEIIGNRGASIIFGLFLFFFGLPFTLVPFMLFSDGVIDINYPFESLFMIAFSVPFLLAGLLVQFLGLSTMMSTFRTPVDPESIPRKLPPGPDGISITEHPDSGYLGDYLRQSEAINGRDWFRKRDSAHRLYYYAQNEGGSPGWSLDDRDDSGSKDWFNGGWFPYDGFELPMGRKQWNVDDGQWVFIQELESFASKEGYEEYLESIRGKPSPVAKVTQEKEWWK